MDPLCPHPRIPHRPLLHSMKFHSELPYLALLVNFVATIGLFSNIAHVGFAAKPGKQLVIVGSSRQQKERNFQKYYRLLFANCEQHIIGVQLGDIINVLSVTNGVVKLFVTRNRYNAFSGRRTLSLKPTS